MRTLIVPVMILASCAYMNSPVMEACGAKFLVATRSPRFQRAQRPTKPATILLYQHSQEADVVEFMGLLQSTLIAVGHTVTLATSEEALRVAATTQKNDVVMMQLDAARRLRSALGSRSPDAAILPMKAYVTRAEAARVKEEFGQMLTLPTTDRKLLSVVAAAYR
jgi:hypothetical protein